MWKTKICPSTMGKAVGFSCRLFKKRKGNWLFGQSPQGKARVRKTKTSEHLLQRQRVAIDIIKTHLTEPLADRPIVLWDDDGNPYILGGRQRKMGKEEAWRSYLNIFERRRLENEKPLSRAQFHKVWISVKLGSRFNKTMCLWIDQLLLIT